MRQRELEIRLERVPHPTKPAPDLEQYRTPPRIAADVLYRALARGDIGERRVLDLGCGTGMFAIGALLLGAESAHGVDVDAAALDAARAAAADLEVEPSFEACDVTSATGRFDTVLMNPPFGAQLAARHADTLFLEKALDLAPVCYSLHLRETARHLERAATRLSADAEELAAYEFPLPHQFKFHTREKVPVSVGLFRYERKGPPSAA